MSSFFIGVARLKTRKREFFLVFLIFILLLLIRSLGWLEAGELSALDFYFRLQPREPTDDRIVIVGITEADIQELGQYPLSDRLLWELLTKIEAQSPRVIGLDLVRDLPVPTFSQLRTETQVKEDWQAAQKLTNFWQQTPNLVGIEQVLPQQLPNQIRGIPGLSRGQLAGADVPVDGDGVVRRFYLYPHPLDGSPKAKIPSLGWELARRYLAAEGIKFKASQTGKSLQVGEVLFPRLQKNDGGYVKADFFGYQILGNWRHADFSTISLTDIWQEKIPPDAFQDKVVLIGSQSLAIGDTLRIPLSQNQSFFGVEYHAQVVSGIVSAVLDERPLISVWSPGMEVLWIAIWLFSFFYLLKILYTHLSPNIFLVASLTISLLASLAVGGFGYFLFIQGVWIPVFPVILELLVLVIVVDTYYFLSDLLKLNLSLEAQVKQRTEELEKAFIELQQQQSENLLKSKLASLGEMVLQVAHQLRNPVHFLSAYLDICEQEINEDSEIDTAEMLENFALMRENLSSLQGIVTQLLESSPRLAAAQVQSCSLKQIVTDSLSLVVNPDNFPIDTNLSADAQVLVNPLKMQQIIINLLENAFYTLREKQNECQESSYQPELKIQTQINSQAKIVVEDNGNGIPEALKSQIFEPFFTTKPQGEGNGLGLYIAWQIIQEFGGNLQVESEIDRFTRFTIILPLDRRF